jgi:hypothetical protein
MPKFVIEREIPEVGKLSPEQLKAISQKSCSVLRELGPKIQWVHSYVTDDKIYCVYIRRTKTRCASMLSRADSPPTGSRKFDRSLIRQPASETAGVLRPVVITSN